jgi:uncharacterized protein (DUF1499 family)
MNHRRLAVITLAIAVLALLLLAASGTGYRAEAWSLRTAFTMIRWAAYVGIAACVAALLGILVARPVGRPTLLFAAALLIAAAATWIPWSWKQRAGAVPPIHDVTTDTQDPPQFVAVLPLRASAPNSAVYGGDSIAVQQRAGYPDLAPVRLALAPNAVFTRARAAVDEMGWTFVAADSAAGRIEATATTRWFGFKDDVVVRVRPDDTGSRVDVRSVSRVGGGDVGANAARIRAFVARLQS